MGVLTGHPDMPKDPGGNFYGGRGASQDLSWAAKTGWEVKDTSPPLQCPWEAEEGTPAGGLGATTNWPRSSASRHSARKAGELVVAGLESGGPSWVGAYF